MLSKMGTIQKGIVKFTEKHALRELRKNHKQKVGPRDQRKYGREDTRSPSAISPCFVPNKKV